MIHNVSKLLQERKSSMLKENVRKILRINLGNNMLLTKKRVDSNYDLNLWYRLKFTVPHLLRAESKPV